MPREGKALSGWSDGPGAVPSIHLSVPETDKSEEKKPEEKASEVKKENDSK